MLVQQVEGFSGSSDGKESTFNVGDLGLIPWVGKIPWRRAWQTIPVFLPGESPWTEQPARLQSMHWVTESDMTERLSTAQQVEWVQDEEILMANTVTLF